MPRSHRVMTGRSASIHARSTSRPNFRSTTPPQEKEWSVYIHGMAAMLERGGVRLKGADMVIDSDIPFGAGLSSSAALEVCAGLALWSVSGGEPDLRNCLLRAKG